MIFRYKLESLLKYRCLLEEQAKQGLAREQLDLEALQQQFDSLQAERLRLAEEFERRKQEQLPVLLFSSYVELLDFRDREVRDCVQGIAAKKARVEEARQLLADRARQRKVIEKAREKSFLQFQQENLRREEKETDEQMTLRHDTS